MSGLAEILLEENFIISGSDAKASDLTKQLESRGAKVYIGQRASNVTPDIDLVVYTAAIHPDNPEFQKAKERNFRKQRNWRSLCSQEQTFWDRS